MKKKFVLKKELISIALVILVFAVAFSFTENSITGMATAHSSKEPVTTTITDVASWYNQEFGKEYPNSRQFMVEIANQESHLGTYPTTYDPQKGDYGFAQFTGGDDDAFVDVQQRLKNKPERAEAIQAKFGFDPLQTEISELDSQEPVVIDGKTYAKGDVISAVFLRENLLADPDPTPTTLEARAQKWKERYNTELGAGKEEKYIQKADGTFAKFTEPITQPEPAAPEPAATTPEPIVSSWEESGYSSYNEWLAANQPEPAVEPQPVAAEPIQSPPAPSTTTSGSSKALQTLSYDGIKYSEYETAEDFGNAIVGDDLAKILDRQPAQEAWNQWKKSQEAFEKAATSEPTQTSPVSQSISKIETAQKAHDDYLAESKADGWIWNRISDEEQTELNRLQAEVDSAKADYYEQVQGIYKQEPVPTQLEQAQAKADEAKKRWEDAAERNVAGPLLEKYRKDHQAAKAELDALQPAVPSTAEKLKQERLDQLTLADVRVGNKITVTDTTLEVSKIEVKDGQTIFYHIDEAGNEKSFITSLNPETSLGSLGINNLDPTLKPNIVGESWTGKPLYQIGGSDKEYHIKDGKVYERRTFRDKEVTNTPEGKAVLATTAPPVPAAQPASAPAAPAPTKLEQAQAKADTAKKLLDDAKNRKIDPDLIKQYEEKYEFAEIELNAAKGPILVQQELEAKQREKIDGLEDKYNKAYEDYIAKQEILDTAGPHNEETLRKAIEARDNAQEAAYNIKQELELEKAKLEPATQPEPTVKLTPEQELQAAQSEFENAKTQYDYQLSLGLVSKPETVEGVTSRLEIATANYLEQSGTKINLDQTDNYGAGEYYIDSEGNLRRNRKAWFDATLDKDSEQGKAIINAMVKNQAGIIVEPVPEKTLDQPDLAEIEIATSDADLWEKAGSSSYNEWLAAEPARRLEQAQAKTDEAYKLWDAAAKRNVAGDILEKYREDYQAAKAESDALRGPILTPEEIALNKARESGDQIKILQVQLDISKEKLKKAEEADEQSNSFWKPQTWGDSEEEKQAKAEVQSFEQEIAELEKIRSELPDVEVDFPSLSEIETATSADVNLWEKAGYSSYVEWLAVEPAQKEYNEAKAKLEKLTKDPKVKSDSKEFKNAFESAKIAQENLEQTKTQARTQAKLSAKITQLSSNNEKLTDQEIDQLASDDLITADQAKSAKRFRNPTGTELAEVIQQNQAKKTQLAGLEQSKQKTIEAKKRLDDAKNRGLEASLIKGYEENYEKVKAAELNTQLKILNSNPERLTDTEIDQLETKGLITKRQAEQAKSYGNTRGTEMAEIIKQNQKPILPSEYDRSTFTGTRVFKIGDKGYVETEPGKWKPNGLFKKELDPADANDEKVIEQLNKAKIEFNNKPIIATISFSGDSWTGKKLFKIGNSEQEYYFKDGELYERKIFGVDIKAPTNVKNAMIEKDPLTAASNGVTLTTVKSETAAELTKADNLDKWTSTGVGYYNPLTGEFMSKKNAEKRIAQYNSVIDKSKLSPVYATSGDEVKAKAWQAAGFTPEQAKIAIDQGFDRPADAKKWTQEILSPTENGEPDFEAAAAWSKVIGVGATKEQAQAWIKAVSQPSGVSAWKEVGIDDPSKVKTWTDAGFTAGIYSFDKTAATPEEYIAKLQTIINDKNADPTQKANAEKNLKKIEENKAKAQEEAKETRTRKDLEDLKNRQMEKKAYSQTWGLLNQLLLQNGFKLYDKINSICCRTDECRKQYSETFSNPFEGDFKTPDSWKDSSEDK